MSYDLRLDLARQHGTKGTVLAYCPQCAFEWEIPVSWSRGAMKWIAACEDSCFCATCWRKWACPVLGKRLDPKKPPRVTCWLTALDSQLWREHLLSLART